MSLHRCRRTDGGRLQRGVHAADVGGAAVPLGAVRRGGRVGALRIRFVGAGIRLLEQLRASLRRRLLPLLAQIRLTPADREQFVRGGERRHARGVVVAGGRPARVRRRRVPAGRSADRSPCCRSPRSSAARRRAPTPWSRVAGRRAQPSRRPWPRSVIVSWSVHSTVPALTASATASSTYSLKIDASGRDSSMLVPATLTHWPSVTLRDLVRVAGAGLGQLGVDVGPLLDHRRVERHLEAVDHACVVGVQFDRLGDAVGGQHVQRGMPGADVDPGDGERPVPPDGVHA